MAHTRNRFILQGVNRLTLESIGNKVKQGAEIVGALKGIWDVGNAIYGAATTAAPYIAPFVRYSYKYKCKYFISEYIYINVW
jgi:hypothetical protein